MLIKKSTIKTAIAIAALSASSAVLAVSANNDSGFVAGLQGGYANTDWSSVSSLSTDYYEDVDISDSGFAGRIYIGYDFNKYIALESGYVYLPNSKGTFTEQDGTSETGTMKSYAFDLLARLSLPLGEKFNLFGKVGGSYLNASGSGDAAQGNSSVTGLAYGLGASYDITPKVGIDVSWTRYSGKGSVGDSDYVPNADVALLGVSYKFGDRT